MMNGTLWNRPFRFALRSDGIRGLLAAVVFSAGGTWCWAAGPAGAPPDETTTTVALNQSASVVAAGQPGGSESSEVAPAGSSTGDPALQTASGATPPSSSAEAKPRRSILPLRQRSRAAAGDGTDRAIKHRAEAWYQTGLGSLGIVLAVVAISVWAVRRWVPAARSGSSSAIRVSGRVNLTPKHSIALVHVGRRYLLVGLSGDRMTILSEVSDPDEVADLAARVNESGTRARGTFDDILISEATDFRSATAPKDEDTKHVPAAIGGRRRLTGLQDLVDRLKSLQTK